MLIQSNRFYSEDRDFVGGFIRKLMKPTGTRKRRIVPLIIRIVEAGLCSIYLSGRDLRKDSLIPTV